MLVAYMDKACLVPNNSTVKWLKIKDGSTRDASLVVQNPDFGLQPARGC
jgi:hypothetical protein